MRVVLAAVVFASLLASAQVPYQPQAASPPRDAGYVTADGTIRIVEVWDSREQAEQFGEKVRGVREELGIGGGGPPQISYLDVYNFVS